MDGDEHKLPGVLSDIAQLVGFPCTLAIVERFGGVRITGLSVILRGGPHPLIDTIGQENATILASAWLGDQIEVPKCERYWRAARNERIRAERKAGITRQQLAITYRLTERQITNIVGEEPDDERQMTTGF